MNEMDLVEAMAYPFTGRGLDLDYFFPHDSFDQDDTRTGDPLRDFTPIEEVGSDPDDNNCSDEDDLTWDEVFRVMNGSHDPFGVGGAEEVCSFEGTEHFDFTQEADPDDPVEMLLHAEDCNPADHVICQSSRPRVGIRRAIALEVGIEWTRLEHKDRGESHGKWRQKKRRISRERITDTL